MSPWRETSSVLRDVLTRSSLSKRQLSAAMGRDPGYVAALLDPSRPSRARPTPANLLRASDATGIPFVEFLEQFWGIGRDRLASELARLGVGSPLEESLTSLTDAARKVLRYLPRHPLARAGARPRGPEGGVS